MPRKRIHCARRLAHRGECRTAAALQETRERKTTRRVGQTLVTPADRARWNKAYRLARNTALGIIEAKLALAEGYLTRVPARPAIVAVA